MLRCPPSAARPLLVGLASLALTGLGGCGPSTATPGGATASGGRTDAGPGKAQLVAFLNEARPEEEAGCEFVDVPQVQGQAVANTPGRVVVQYRAAGRLTEDRFVPLSDAERTALMGGWTATRWKNLRYEVLEQGLLNNLRTFGKEKTRALAEALEHPPKLTPATALVLRAVMKRGQEIVQYGSLTAEQQMDHWRLSDPRPGAMEPALIGNPAHPLVLGAIRYTGEDVQAASEDDVRAAVPLWAEYERTVEQARAKWKELATGVERQNQIHF